MSEPPDALPRARADLEAARRLIAAKDAELVATRALVTRLVADAVLKRHIIAGREAEIARVPRFQATTLREWLGRGFHLLLGARGAAVARRLTGALRRRPPPPEPPASPSALGTLGGRPLLEYLGCPQCGHAPLAEAWTLLTCPACTWTVPVVGGIPVFAGASVDSVVRPPAIRESVDRAAVLGALTRVLEAGGAVPRPPGAPPAPEASGRFRPVRTRLDAPTLPLPGPRRPGVRRLLFLTHTLNLEGAPIFQLSLARSLERDRYEVVVLSPVDGPLRARYEAEGIPVSILDVFRETDGRPEYQAATTGLARWARTGEFDLVFCNTLMCYWGVAVARLAGRPSVWKIHESVDWRSYFEYLDPELRREALACLQQADRLVFTADATRKLFHELEAPGRIRTIYCGLDVAAIDAFQARHSKATARASHGLSDADRVVSVIGTTCERKGQLDFLEMAMRLGERRPAGRLHFYLVGAREGEYLDRLRRFVREHGLERVVFVEETPDVYQYFRMTDVFVCPSYRESFPLVILEAMAFGLPIVATAVFGIPEAVTDGRDALLTAPGDVEGLTARVGRILDDPALAARLGAEARTSFAGRFTLERLGREYDALFRELEGPGAANSS